MHVALAALTLPLQPWERIASLLAMAIHRRRGVGGQFLFVINPLLNFWGSQLAWFLYNSAAFVSLFMHRSLGVARVPCWGPSLSRCSLQPWALAVFLRKHTESPLVSTTTHLLTSASFQYKATNVLFFLCPPLSQTSSSSLQWTQVLPKPEKQLCL